MVKTAIILLCLLCSAATSATAQSRLNIAEVHFLVNRSNLDPNYRDNARSLAEISEMLEDKVFMRRVEALSIYAMASPEGPAKGNFSLSRNRAAALRSYILQNHAAAVTAPIDLRSQPATWADMEMYVRNDVNCPRRDEVLWLLSEKNNVTDEKREYQLKSLMLGELWDYLRRETLFFMRTSWLSITLKAEVPVGDGQPVLITSSYPELPQLNYRFALEQRQLTRSKQFSVKTNVLYGAVAYATNLAFEVAVCDNERTTLDVGAGYNWFNRDGRPGDNKKRVHYLIQPEFRYYFKERFKGHFVGAHTFFTQYNICRFEMPYLFGHGSEDYRLEGLAFGVGLSYGYQYQVNEWFGVEATLGGGYARLIYDVYDFPRCGLLVDRGRAHNYFGVTRAGISAIFYLQRRVKNRYKVVESK